MPEMSVIGAFVSSVKTAVDIAKALNDVNTSFAQVDLKIQLTSLIDSLVDSKFRASEIQELLAEKDHEIERLKDALRFKADLVFSDGAYYETTDEGTLTGFPYCSPCWEGTRMAIHLSYAEQYAWYCGSCQGTFVSNIVNHSRR